MFNNKKEIEDWLNKLEVKKYIINDNLVVDVIASVDIQSDNLKYLPVKFGHVTGSFSCAFSSLISLKGSPDRVDGHFDCSHNSLNSLKYLPPIIGSYLNCSNNELISLKFCNPIVNGGFYCKNNKLKTLEFGPTEVDGDFDCSMNKLKSLTYSSLIIKGSYFCRDNKIVSLKGCPFEINGELNCTHNKLTSLDGVGIVRGTVNCEFNKIKTLKSSLQYVDGNILINANLVDIDSNLKYLGGELIHTNSKKISGFEEYYNGDEMNLPRKVMNSILLEKKLNIDLPLTAKFKKMKI